MIMVDYDDGKNPLQGSDCHLQFHDCAINQIKEGYYNDHQDHYHDHAHDNEQRL